MDVGKACRNRGGGWERWRRAALPGKGNLMLTNRKPGAASSLFTPRFLIRHELKRCVEQVGLSQSAGLSRKFILVTAALAKIKAFNFTECINNF